MNAYEKIRAALRPYPGEHERQAALAALAELERAAATNEPAKEAT